MVADNVLAKQLSYVEVYHNLCAAAASAARLREGKLGESSARDIPVTEESAAAICQLRRDVQAAEDMTRMDCFANIFEAPSQPEGHLADLDAFVSAAPHSQSILGFAKAEQSLWADAVGKCLEALVRDTQASTPAGWVLKKADILDDSNAAIVTALLSNTSFTRLSQSVSALCNKFAILQNLKRSSGQNLVSPTIWESCKTTLASGSETVSVTYALHQLTRVIPKLPNATQKKAAAGKLLSDVRQRGVDLGPSITAECARLQTLT